jgi:dTDP-4-amino-4,6-dideoxygalactose transaminase
VEEQVSESTKAVIVMHYGGFPCKMNEILELARKHNLCVIEDAAHAPGGRLNGLPLGTWGDMGCFSFFSNKNLITGEGGMLVTNQDELAEKVRRLRSHGMTSLTWDRHHGHAYSYDVTDLGYNYRIDEIRSALGRVQLKKLLQSNVQRQRITQQYWDAFRDLPVMLPFRDTPGEPAYHIFPLLLPAGMDRQIFIEALRAKGIQTSIHYPPIHQFKYYRENFGKIVLPRTEDLAAREVTLPLYPGMTDEQVEMVIHEVRSILKVNVK